MLSLAGNKIPEHMQRKPFLGDKKVRPRNYVYGHRDRVDEVRDFAHAVRNHRYLYIRNYIPHLGYNQPTAWPDLGEVREEFYRLAKSGKMTSAQKHFAGKRRPVEELYDCETDPQNLFNLADSPEHQNTLLKFRGQHLKYAKEIRDWGFVPEYEAWQLAKESSGWEVGQNSSINEEKNHSSSGNDRTSKTDRYYKKSSVRKPNRSLLEGAVGLAAVETRLSKSSLEVLRNALTDSSPSVRIEAANTLVRNGQEQPALNTLIDALKHPNLFVVTHAARTVELLGKRARGAIPAMEDCLKRAYKIRPPDLSPVVVLPGDQDMAMFVGFSCNAFFEKSKMTGLGDFIFRPMQKEDSRDVAELIHHSTNYWYRANGKDSIFKGPPSDTLLFCDVYEDLDPGCCLMAICRKTERIAGSCFYHPRESHVSLGIMNVSPDFFGQGVARSLLLK